MIDGEALAPMVRQAQRHEQARIAAHQDPEHAVSTELRVPGDDRASRRPPERLTGEHARAEDRR